MIRWFYLFFFLSGLTALVYETTFAHQLHLIFGSTLSAVSLVLAVYLGGIAMGAALLGKRADKMSPLKLYGILEIGIGLTALAAVFLVPLIRYIYVLCPVLRGSSSLLCFIFQALLTVIILLPSTLLMGGTLPVLARGLTVSLGQRFRRISWLYGLNTIGAALGTLLCGFILLENFGYLGTVSAAMAANVIIGVFALYLSRRDVTHRTAAAKSESPAHKKAPPEPVDAAPGLRRLVLILAGISGFAALGYEIIWFRILTFSVVADAYAFAQMLGIYLLGIGGGSLLAAWRFKRKEGSDWERTGAWFELGVMELLVSLLVVAGFASQIWINQLLGRPSTSNPNFWALTLRNTSLQAIVLIFPVTFLLGYIFPLLVSLYSANLKRLGRQVGWVAAINTTGAILGVFISAFLLIPSIGIQNSLAGLAALSAVVGIVALLFGQMQLSRRKIAILSAIPVVTAALILFPTQSNFGFQQIPTHDNAKLLFYKESSDQTVIVTEDKGFRKVRRLLLNQQQATSTGLAGQRKNQLLGHLPLWACPDAKKALVICFGSGGTFGALGLYDLERVDCVEICASVLKAAPLFSEWNGNVLHKDHVRVIIDDGRSYLLKTEEKYDVITLEPMHPGLKGVASLYSREFYQEARKRLNPGGALCQWVPLYSMTCKDARSLIATAVNVFPQSSLWIVGSEGILLCSNGELTIDGSWLEKGEFPPEIRKALKRVLIDDPWAIFSGYFLGPEGLQNYVKDHPVLRDDRPFTEYTIPRHQHLNPWEDILALADQRESPIPLLTNVSLECKAELRERFERSRKGWVARDKGFAAYDQADFQSARKYLEAAYQNEPTDRYAAYFLKEIYWRYGVDFSLRKMFDRAVLAYQRAVDIDPEDSEARLYLALAFEQAGQKEAALEEAEYALNLQSDLGRAQQLVSRLKYALSR
ncbi:MAG: hypothetical protein ABIE92_00480 [bacterium]